MDQLGAAPLTKGRPEQRPWTAPLRKVDVEGEKRGSSGEGGRAVLPLPDLQLEPRRRPRRDSNWGCGQGDPRGLSECFISWRQHQP